MRKVIQNIPVRIPLNPTILYALVLDRFEAPGYIWGVYATVFTLLWIGSIKLKLNEEKVDLFGSEKSEKKTQSKSFRDKLNEKINEAQSQN